MPQILVTTNVEEAGGAVLLRERVNLTDFDSDHFSSQLVERLGWAVVDADEIEKLSRARAEARPSLRAAA